MSGTTTKAMPRTENATKPLTGARVKATARGGARTKANSNTMNKAATRGENHSYSFGQGYSSTDTLALFSTGCLPVWPARTVIMNGGRG